MSVKQKSNGFHTLIALLLVSIFLHFAIFDGYDKTFGPLLNNWSLYQKYAKQFGPIEGYEVYKLVKERANQRRFATDK